MRYYVVADVHGFFDEFRDALEENGFFSDAEPHKLIVCGDLFDRGNQAAELLDFILDLMERDEVILIRGNHEDLTLDLLNGWHKRSYSQYYNHTNGTIDTVLQLTNSTIDDLNLSPDSVGKKFLQNPFIQTVIPAMHDYYETPNYIFVHGWIPCTALKLGPHKTQYARIADWRNANTKAWDSARWQNGMEAAYNGITEPGKTIVCGHWHCSFGHANYENNGGEFDNNPDFSPFYGEGIVALDACTIVSQKVNCIVIDD